MIKLNYLLNGLKFSYVEIILKQAFICFITFQLRAECQIPYRRVFRKELRPARSSEANRSKRISRRTENRYINK